MNICHFPHGIPITKDFAKASVNSIIDNIQVPLFLASLMLSLRAQCEWNLSTKLYSYTPWAKFSKSHNSFRNRAKIIHSMLLYHKCARNMISVLPSKSSWPQMFQKYDLCHSCTQRTTFWWNDSLVPDTLCKSLKQLCNCRKDELDTKKFLGIEEPLLRLLVCSYTHSFWY